MRVSVSDIDQLRYYRQTEDMPLEDLLARLRREIPPTRQMLAGTAFHDLLEHSGDVELTHCERNGFRFSFDMERELVLPEVREIKAEKIYRMHGIDVTLVGKVDAIDGVTVYDHKLTSRYDAERYANSFQWRCYLDIFKCSRFVYNVFVAKDEGQFFRVRDFETLPLYAYPGMADDVRSELAAFVEFAMTHLPEKLEKAA